VKKFRLAILAAAMILTIIGCGPRETVVARVGREKITSQEFKDEFIRRHRTEENAQRQSFQVREKVLRDMSVNLAFYQMGLDKKIDERQQVKDQLSSTARRKALDLLYRKQVVEKVITDDAAKKFYDKSGEEIRARHILLKTAPDTSMSDTTRIKARLDSIMKAVAAGLDFKAAAKMFSEDGTSAADSGDLGFFQWGRMVEEFQQAAWSAKPGQVVGPVRTNYGYHLIRVEERRPIANRKSFAESKEQIKSQLHEVEGGKMMDVARAYVESLRKAAKLTYDEKNMDVFRKRLLDPTISQTQSLSPMFTEDQKALTVATYKGGKVTLNELIQKVAGNAGRVNWNDKQAVLDLVHAIAEPILLEKDAEKQGFYKTALKSPEVVAEKRRAITAMLEKEEITDKVSPTEADEKRFYESHLANFIQPETRVVREIFIKEDSLKAAGIRTRALKGENFAKLALRYNEKESTKPDTGRIGPFEEKRFGFIGKTAFMLKNVGDISDVLAVGTNYSVIQLLNVLPSRTKSFDEAQADVRRQTRQTMTDERRKTLEEEALQKFSLDIDAKALAAVWPITEKKEDKIAREP